MAKGGVMCIVNAIYWLICFVLCLWFIFGLGALIYLIASICNNCCGCNSIEKIGLKWLASPGVCFGNMIEGRDINCDCIVP